jgi:hypothetical protein
MTNQNGSAEVPIACSLTASEARERVERWRKLVQDARLRSLSGDGYAATAFRNEPAVRAELEALASAERECCAFLQFDLRKSKAELVLRVTAKREEARNDLALLISSLGLG